MRESLERNVWTVAAVLLGGVIMVVGYAATLISGGSIAQYLGILAATLAGVVAGVPVGLSLSDRDRAIARKDARHYEEMQRDRLIQQIYDDLWDTRMDLLHEMRQPRKSGIVPFLGSGMWETLKATTEIRLIEDAHLLRQISRAYDRISVTSFLEQNLMTITLDPAGHMTPLPVRTLAIEMLTNQDPHTQGAIDEALKLLVAAGAEHKPSA